MSKINIYVQDKTLAGLMKSLEPSCKIYAYIPDDIDPDELNLILVNETPEQIIDNAKYILYNKNDKESQYQKRLLEMARQDYLTGLATRWYLQEYVEHTKHEDNITCIYFDLDNFKQINDNYGHMAGDRALAATAEMMQCDFADGFVARMGGDEFMVVLPGERSASEVEDRVNAFMKSLVEYYKGINFMKTLSVSAGISQRKLGSEKSIDRLIHESDIALYEAKNSGRACCRIYAPSMEAAINKA